MSKLLDDIKRAAEARRKLEQTRAPDPTHSGFDDERPGKTALHGKAEAESTQRFLAWRQAERAARELSTREAARTWRFRWLPAAAASGTALAIGVGIGSLLKTGSEPAPVPAVQPAVQMRPGPPLQLRLETHVERFGRRASATALERGEE